MLAYPPAKTVFYVLGFVAIITLLFALGLWQWQRGAAKAHIEQQLAKQHDLQSTQRFTDTMLAQLNYTQVRLAGRWLSTPIFLLENRSHNGQRGFHVLQPFELINGQYMLINRGWQQTQSIHEEVSRVLPSEQQVIEGRLFLPQKGFTLGAAFANDYDGPLAPEQVVYQMQYYDFAQIAKRLGHGILPAILILQQEHDLALTVNWQPYYMTPNRHYGYAVQWWGLALVACIYALIFFRRRRHHGCK